MFYNCSNFYGFFSGIIYREEKEIFSSRLIHEFVMRLVDCGKNNKVLVKLDDRIAKFGMQEFCLIIGLPCHQPVMEIDYSNNCLRNHYFNGSQRISMKMLFDVFHECEDLVDKFKLGFIMLVECVIKPIGRIIDYKTLGMVEHLDEFLG
ncbi:Hypothetical predicted protein [Olea europaea subsp. europaea]|uniref:DUF1985 domain-containing protein n=1 Tax=Olea europaea subsp. europaea TaxID=158383 RepID=A0A8S0V238_OLEEU|nr:Hypothetical predicted protein [Olea europaea subsp. europaea]